MAPLSDDMLSLAGEIIEITPQDYVEGPFMVRRGGQYIFMWSEGNWTDATYRVAYGVAETPFGPFPRVGAILGTEPGIANGAGHHSALQIPGSDEFIICYHRRLLDDLNPHHRVTCLESMSFDSNGAIIPVRLTNEGVAARPM